MTDWSKRDKLSDEEREYIANNLPGGQAELEEHDRYWEGDMSDRELSSMKSEGDQSGKTEPDDDYDEWTNDELRQELENRNLGSQGKKAELINRLRMNDAENPDASTQG